MYMYNDESIDLNYAFVGIKSRQNVFLFDTNEIQPHVYLKKQLKQTYS